MLFQLIVSLLYAYAVWQDNLTIYRMITIIGSIGWIIYNCIVGAYVSILGNSFQLLSAIIAIIRLDLRRNK